MVPRTFFRLLGILLTICRTSAAPAQLPVTQPTRVELHVHLDGSVGAEDLYRIGTSRGLVLPGISGVAQSAEDLRGYIASQSAWHRFDIINDIIGGSTQAIRAIAEAFVAFQARSGVAYTEVRYDPVRLSQSTLAKEAISEAETVAAVQAGLEAGATAHGVSVFQILCAMRGQPEARCYETARLAARMKSQDMGGVVGLDIAGDEVSYPNPLYVACLRDAKVSMGLKTTAHAGEFNGTTADEVQLAVQQMGVDRIGHGYAAVMDEGTLELLTNRHIHLEACPRSAQRHGPWELEAIATFKKRGLSFGLNTDDPSCFFGDTTAAGVEVLVKRELGFTDGDVRLAHVHALSAAFGPSSVTEPLRHRLEREATEAAANIPLIYM